MGKHKLKRHKDKKKHKKTKKSRTRNSTSSSEEEWVEKRISESSSDDEKITKNTIKSSNSGYVIEENITTKNQHDSRTHLKVIGTSYEQREEWMNLSSGFQTLSNSDRKRERDEKKRLEREKQQYDPRKCDRELNPYWKHGGDGLPTFKKPGDQDETVGSKQYLSRYQNRTSNWRKSKSLDSSRSSSKGTDEYVGNKLTKIPIQQEKLEYWNSSRRKNEELSGSDRNICSDGSKILEKYEDKGLSDSDLNILASKLVKAEIMGNVKLVNELKEKLESARNSVKNISNDDEILLTHTDSQGRFQPLKQQSDYGESSSRKRKRIETHKDGERVRYFADDDKYSLKQMFENEKYNLMEDQNSEFITMSGKIDKNDDFDDIFSDNIRKKVSDSKIDSKNRDRAIHDHQKKSKCLDNCNKCIQSKEMPKHLMISMSETSYLMLPAHEPLTQGHCFVIPIRHVPCATQLDENEWEDIRNIQKSLIKLFKSKNEVVVFFESAKSLHHYPHMYIECVPLPSEEGNLAPIYFKKAIDDSEIEWVQNKKLVSLKGRDVRRAIPKGLPYFSVNFGIDDGYAHVIEDEQLFPANFAQEIIGGLLDLHHGKWRKPKNQSFEEQSKRTLQFSNEWKNF